MTTPQSRGLVLSLKVSCNSPLDLDFGLAGREMFEQARVIFFILCSALVYRRKEERMLEAIPTQNLRFRTDD